MAKKQTLSDEVKAFIVTNLASFEPPSAVAALVKDEFGLVVSRQSVSAYDPTTKQGKDLSAKWKSLFERARKDFRESTDDIPLANKAVRIRMLDRMARHAIEKKNAPLAQSLLKQIAEEMGDVFTNRHKLEHTGRSGGPIETRAQPPIDPTKLTTEELEAFDALLSKAKPDARGSQGGASAAV